MVHPKSRFISMSKTFLARFLALPKIRQLPFLALALLVVLSSATAEAAAKKGKKKGAKSETEDPYADFVWPPPPDKGRIKLEEILSGRGDVEAESKLKRTLLGASPQSRYDWLSKPFAVAFDGEGRILVSDTALGAVLRFDREGRKLDVLGTQGAVRLKRPLGLHAGSDGRVYVADVGLSQVVAYDGEGKVRAVYGRPGELTNPTDSVLSRDGKKLYVADSKAHQIVVFDAASAERLSSFGRRGEAPGEFAFPTSLALDSDENLFVVDQINSRVQVLTTDGEPVDAFGSLGVGFGNFVRPKDVAVDEVGFVYVTDNAYNNVQLFDADLSLLTFLGEGGTGPGRFHGASGVAVRGDEIAVVDQLGHRVQVFRFIVPKDQ
jgi:DNA-binding beta-propeller fold protein YncE